MELVGCLHAKNLIAICLLGVTTQALAQSVTPPANSAPQASGTNVSPPPATPPPATPPPATPPPATATPGNDAFEGQLVMQITFDPVAQPLEQSVIDSLIPFRAGQPYHASDAAGAIQKLYATGRYEDIQIDVEPAGSRPDVSRQDVSRPGITLRFITNSSWFFGHVQIHGEVSEPPSLGQMLSVAGLALGQPFDPAQVSSGEEKIRQLLVDNGYFDATVSHHFDYETAYQQVRVTYEVHVGKRAHYTPPVISGDTSVLSAKAIDKATDWHRFLVPGYRGITQSRTRAGIDKIRLTYQKSNRLLATVTFGGITAENDTGNAKRTPLGTEHITVNPGSVVDVKATGAKVSQKTLREYLPIYEEGTVDSDLLAEGVTNLRDYFQQRGYFDVAVDFSRQQEHDGKTEIEYAIQPGLRHRLVSVIIRGNKYFDEKTVRERMSVLAKSFEFRRGRYSEALAARDKAVIEDLYRANGFRDIHVVTETKDDYKTVKGDIAAFFSIDEGHQYLVTSLTITGADKLDLTKTLDHLTSQVGQPFSEFDVSSDRGAILERYGAAGYSNATFEWSWNPGAKPYTVDLKFVIQEGDPQFVREVVVTGLSTTRRRLVDRQVQEHPDDPLSAASMAETQRRLYDLAIFSQVNMAVQNQDGDEERRIILYDLQEASRYSITTGLGTEFGRLGGGTAAEDLSNPGGTATLTPRVSLALTRLNLFGLGQSLSLQFRFSTLQKRASLTYFVPRIFGRSNLNGNFSVLYDDTFAVDTFRAVRREVSSEISEHVSRTITTFYRFAYRDVGVSDLKISPLLVPHLAQSVRVGIASFYMVHDRRDDPVDPHKGIYTTLDVGLAARALGSQTSFVRVLGRNATYYRLGPKIVLARETQFGVEPAFDLHGPIDPSDPDPIPLSERFYGGGGSTMRGYPQNQAGPRDGDTGFPLGGSAQFFNSTEIRFPLYGANIRGVLFEDFGNVFSSIGSISFRVDQRNISDFDYMSHAVGFGVRYRTPLGPLRLDIAYSLNPPKYNGFPGDYSQLVQCSASGTCQTSTQHISHIQFFFSIGQAF
jgi:outer membrane protein insertion porin family